MSSASIQSSFDGLHGAALPVVIVVGMAVLTGCQFAFGVLRPTDSPGILKFEFVGTPERATRIFKAAWAKDPEVRKKIRTALWVDSLVFVPAYVTVLTILCLTASPTNGGRGVGDFATGLAWFALIAGLLDIAENAALLRVLGNLDAAGRWTYMATALAITKFVLLAFVVVSLLARWVATG